MPVTLEVELALGTGRKVGVAGREEEVGKKLDVDDVLRLDPDNCEEGRRMPLFIRFRARDASVACAA